MDVAARARGWHLAPTRPEAAYLSLATGLAAWGFVSGSTAVILTAFAVVLPAGVLALVGYYLLYGLLALVPGANPDESSGSSCSAGLACRSHETGQLAAWFDHGVVVLGVLLVASAAVANLALLRALAARRHQSR